MGMLLIGIACSSAAADLLWQLGWVKGQLQKKSARPLAPVEGMHCLFWAQVPGIGLAAAMPVCHIFLQGKECAACG
jgi:hypothetical protein